MLLEKSLEKKNNKYMVGLDLGDRDAQISFCSTQQAEAETVPAVAGTKQYNIPVMLCKRKGTRQWSYGREALRMAQDGEGIFVDNLFSGAIEGKKILIEGEEYEVLTLLTLFIKKCFGLFSVIAPLDRIEVLMFTARDAESRVAGVIQQVVETLDLKNTRVFFQSHEESYYYYLLHQEQEFRQTGSVILDFEEMLRVYRLEWNRRTTPVVSFVTAEECEECVQPLWAGEETEKKRQMEELDEKMLEKVINVFQNREIGSVFLIGSGFQENWADRMLQYICRGRRVFKGNNLYSKGAAYGALEKFCLTKEGKEHTFLGREKLKTNIGLQILREEKEVYLPLLDAGIDWHDAACEKEFYLESGSAYQVMLTPLTNVFPERETAGKYPVRYEKVDLSGLPARPDGATRLRVSMYMDQAEKLHIKTEDLGFGELFRSSGLIWEQDIAL